MQTTRRRPNSGLILAVLASLTVAAPALAHAEHEDGSKTIRVEPVRDPARAAEIIDTERAHLPTPTLFVGMDAPKLTIAEWVKGDSVQELGHGRTHVVEFWARWCGPCIRAFPHLSDLQKEHADDVTFIGVNIWDPRNPDSETVAETHQGVKEFVTKQGDKMGYTVAIEERGKMSQNWMRAAGQNGIPAAFIVDGEGRVAWIGNPAWPEGAIDRALEQIVSGEWDLDKAADEYAAQLKENESSYWYRHLMNLLADEAEAERGYQLAYAMIRTPMAKNTRMLNAISWNILTNEKIPVRDRDAAVTLASVACEQSSWEDASIIDTLARGYFDKGDHDKAVMLQAKAVEAAGEDSPMAEDLKATLERYTAAATD